MNLRCILLAAMGAAGVALAGDGAFEISNANVPITITNSGRYVVTEDLYMLNGEIIGPCSSWKYLDNGSDQGTAWRDPAFDDSAWSNGVAKLGYGDGYEGTVVSYGPNANNKYITTYFRRAFEIANKSAITHLDLFVRRDDGIVVYLNGNEVLRDNMPAGTITYLTLATSNVPDVVVNVDPEATFYEFFVSPTNLVNGTNVIAAEVHQFSANSADLGFDLALHGYASGTGNPTNAITIATNHVSIDLRGHVLTGSELGTRNAIEIQPGIHSVLIQNGTLTRWGDSGINTATDNFGVIVKDVRSIGNMRDGINVGRSSAVLDCLAANNGQRVKFFERGDGIVVGEGSVVNRCVSFGNYNHGFLANSSCDLTDLLSARNSHDFLHGGQGLVVSRMVCAYSPPQIYGPNKQGDGVEVALGSVVTRSTAIGVDDGMKTREDANTRGRCVYAFNTVIRNSKDGIKGQDGSVFAFNNAFANGDDGITMTTQCVIFANMAARNGFVAGGTPGGGIYMEGAGNFAAWNHTINNETGVAAVVTVASISNLIVCNSAGRNLGNYNIRAGNFAGPITNNVNLPLPWANFRLGN